MTDNEFVACPRCQDIFEGSVGCALCTNSVWPVGYVPPHVAVEYRLLCLVEDVWLSATLEAAMRLNAAHGV